MSNVLSLLYSILGGARNQAKNDTRGNSNDRLPASTTQEAPEFFSPRVDLRP